MPIQFDCDGEIDVTTATESVKKELSDVTGKFQNGAFALLLLALPGNDWNEFLTENELTSGQQKQLKEKLKSYGFSNAFAKKVTNRTAMAKIQLAATSMDDLRSGIFGKDGLFPLFQYAGGAGCDRSKLVALVHQARAAETAIRTAILQANKL